MRTLPEHNLGLSDSRGFIGLRVIRFRNRIQFRVYSIFLKRLEFRL